MNLTHYNDNARCQDIIRGINPEWLDAMPMLAGLPDDGLGGKVITRSAYSPKKQQGVIAFYFGHGCHPSDNGWAVVIMEPVSPEFFLGAAHNVITEMSIAIGATPPDPGASSPRPDA